MRDRRINNQRIFGLRPKTYLSVIIIILLGINLMFIGWTIEAYLPTHYQLKLVKPQYTKPVVDLKGESRASYIIHKIWGKDAYIGMALAKCESGFREKVVNSIFATGYFQINAPVHKVPVEDMQNGYANAGFAYKLFKEQGLTPWVSSIKCWKNEI